ncbi:hypothetical protein B0T24DRAFT_632595 [Lasiosphaeria ovina]|uniref:Nephrocystin 3-like N-terminal domain-containing protein n=1 Tax=Lasiosphaeria ovina TaxID=92902 RepID=A0AAE0K4I7_9PEZI|nr:hypothetical protein B0T24DRAFT_632595 [Lasiosphaeria ovina]
MSCIKATFCLRRTKPTADRGAPTTPPGQTSLTLASTGNQHAVPTTDHSLNPGDTATPVPGDGQETAPPVPDDRQETPLPVPASGHKDPPPIPDDDQETPFPIPRDNQETPFPVPAGGREEPPPAMPTALRDLWEEAKGKLDEKDQLRLSKISDQLAKARHPSSQPNPAGSSSTDDIDAVISKARNMRDEKRNAWQPYIDKIVDAAVRFKQLGDAAMKLDRSGYGALAWSVVSFGLEIAKNAKDAHSIILTSSDTIAQLRSRYTEYESLYRSEVTDSKFEDRIVDVYKALFLYMMAVNDYLQQSGWSRSAHATVSADDRDVSAKKKEVERVGKEVDKYISHIVQEKYAKRRVEEIVERIDAREQLEILDWISKMPYGSNHITVKEARTQDTCDWLLQCEEFGEWSNGSSVILWLQGSPGAGKTFLWPG